ncbi:hypothetical protein HMPREF1988_02159 [Porphyromonas gingivalis F0185]|uniref:DUF5063 domain-containing protein n=1 Tax=Porphyromonas gingivalis TaxID=837 RepID=UPI0003ACF9E2|nr:DUF5063 domain-containing protein [Porphyromonas gingivalis]ERJ80966.1 hypothetical protein HMPREF1988_02159 [Porphyromonas gingivalis F0185]ERJ81728.1 hypothetical protein HMPREF1989_02347 [Porphyromonas gingivalis F0566]
MKETNAGSVYSPELIEFATVGVEFCALVEQAAAHRTTDFIDKASKVLPLLYLKTALLPPYEYSEEVDFVEEYITEESYEQVRSAVESLLGSYDSFLDARHSDMQYSDTPVGASIGECLADVYQQVGNLLGVVRQSNDRAIPQAIGRCLTYFGEYWGNRLLAAASALHELRYSEVYRTWEEEERAED